MDIRATAVLDCQVPNYEPEMPGYFEAWEGEKLQGTLAVFAPTPHTAELTAFTPPAFRRRGTFRALLREAEGVLRAHGYRRLLFVVSSDSPEGQAVAARWGLELEHAEYQMVWDGTVPDVRPLELSPAAPADVPALAELYADSFGDNRAEAEHMVRQSLTIYRTARRDGVLIGAANIQDGEVLSIYGVAVARDLRGQGCGKALMAALLSELDARRDGRAVTLEVDSANATALALYRACGFTERRREDYYRRAL